MPQFNANRVRFAIDRAESLDLVDWDQVRDLVSTAFAHTLKGRSRHEIEHAVTTDSTSTFMNTRLNPELSFPDNSFRKKLVVRAFDTANSDELIGYSYAANNTSGPSVRRALKMAVPPNVPLPVIGGKRYAFHREIAVAPHMQHRGIAHLMGYLSLGEFDPRQVATAYTWPDELRQMPATLESIGMHRTDSARYPIFNEGEPIAQGRWAGTVAEVMHGINMLPGATLAIIRADTYLTRNI